MVRIGLSVTAALFGLLLGDAALAQVGASATAESLFRDAKELMSQEKYAEACDKLEASYAIEETLGTLLNLANCHELEGRTATAWAEFLRAAGVARSAGQAEREKIARDRANSLEARLMRLQIEIAPEARVPGLTLERGGTLIEEAAWGSAIPVDPGPHRIRASAPGKQAREETVELVSEGATVVYELLPLENAPEPEPDPPPPVVASPLSPEPEPFAAVPVDPVDSSAGSGQRTVGLVVGAVGAAGLAAGSVFGVLAKNQWDTAESEGCAAGTCPSEEGQKASEDANRFALLGTVGLAGGGALLLGGIVIYLTAPSGEASSTLPRLSATASSHGLSVDLQGVF